MPYACSRTCALSPVSQCASKDCALPWNTVAEITLPSWDERHCMHAAGLQLLPHCCMRAAELPGT